MPTENLNLKICLVFLSFAPLCFLLTIKCFDIGLYISLIRKFFDDLSEIGFKAFTIAIKHPSFGGLVISVIGIGWLFVSFMIMIGFNGMQKAGFQSKGEFISIKSMSDDSEAVFL